MPFAFRVVCRLVTIQAQMQLVFRQRRLPASSHPMPPEFVMDVNCTVGTSHSANSNLGILVNPDRLASSTAAFLDDRIAVSVRLHPTRLALAPFSGE